MDNANGHSAEAECAICRVAHATAPEDVLHNGPTFTAATGMNVPGWALLWTNRHDAQGLWDLTDEESQDFGLLVRDLGAALRQECSAERAYIMAMGEHALHFHAMVMARPADTPEGARGPAILGAAPTLADVDRAREVAVRIRTALASASSA